jgi:hypothetical protein
VIGLWFLFICLANEPTHHHAHCPSPRLCREEIKLPTAAQAIKWVENVLDAGLQHLLDNERTPDKIDPFLVRDATMLGMSIGHVGLVVRISIVRTIKAPEFSGMTCRVNNCPVHNCCGNTLRPANEHAMFSANDSGDEDGDGDVQYVMRIAHHKTTSAGISMPPIKIESRKLNALITAYLSLARPKVGQWLGIGGLVMLDRRSRPDSNPFRLCVPIIADCGGRSRGQGDLRGPGQPVPHKAGGAVRGPHGVVRGAAHEAEGPLPPARPQPLPHRLCHGPHGESRHARTQQPGRGRHHGQLGTSMGGGANTQL